MTKQCYHCGKECDQEIIFFDEKDFCCNGCKTVFELLSTHHLTNFYSLNHMAGIEPDENAAEKFEYLNSPEVQNTLWDFKDDKYAVIQFYIPVIHCTSCIWLLENLPTINPSIVQSEVDFTQKTLTLTFLHQELALAELAVFLTQLGYKPIISHETASSKKKVPVNRKLTLQLAIAFFCAGNIMLLAFPDYFGSDTKWLEGDFKNFFRWLMFIFSLPIIFYSAQDFFKSAFKGIEHNNFNMDVPISLGIIVLFLRSTYDIVFDKGYGFFDSLGGFVFFLLLGRYFQQSTYNYLSFDRDYKSFYPIAITKIVDSVEKTILLSELAVGDRLLIRNEEIIPADAILISPEAHIDNSFVTGESRLVPVVSGEKIYAGGKQNGRAIEVEIVKSLDQSYLTQLWNNSSFKEPTPFKQLTDRISKIFTIRLLLLAFLTGIGWYFYAPNRMFEVVTSVLIVACPCAISLSAPFTLGNMMRLLAKNGFYVKDTSTIEKMAQIDHIVFDKTGTLTENDEAIVQYEGTELSVESLAIIKSAVKNSNHPLSRIIEKQLQKYDDIAIDSFKEMIGKGIEVTYNNTLWKIGSPDFANAPNNPQNRYAKVAVNKDGKYLGIFFIQNKYRKEIQNIITSIDQSALKISVLSGDNDSELENLNQLMPANTPILFSQTPQDKLEYIKKLQQKQRVMMIGDGLNDAGALQQSDIGISIADNINSFSPSCDAILDSDSFINLYSFLDLSKKAVLLVKVSFVISLLYNIIGLIFAITGYLNPLVAAILMPLSSITVVFFATISTSLATYLTLNKG